MGVAVLEMTNDQDPKTSDEKTLKYKVFPSRVMVLWLFLAKTYNRVGTPLFVIYSW